MKKMPCKKITYNYKYRKKLTPANTMRFAGTILGGGVGLSIGGGIGMVGGAIVGDVATTYGIKKLFGIKKPRRQVKWQKKLE